MSDPLFVFEYSGETFELAAGDNTIGSGADCTVRIEGAGVGEHHATATVAGDGILLRTDLKSDDIRVNGKPTRVEDLEAGDAIRVGLVEFKVEKSDDSLRLTGAGGEYELKNGENTVGRDAEAAIVVDEDSVSREHASILVLPSGRVRIRDLLSANGTFVNDRRLGQVELSGGDKVEIGGARLVMLVLQPPAGAAAGQIPSTDESSTQPIDPGATRLATELEIPPPPGATPPVGGPRFEILFDGETRPLAPGTYKIGRAPDCEFQITDDSEVSRHHAVITATADEVKLKDLESSNGTKLNDGKFRGEFVLKSGDKIGVGASELIFKSDEPVDFMGKTVMAQDVLAGLDATVLSAEIPAPGVIKALDLLDLDLQASPESIRRRFQELYSDFQIKVTNAPTPELKEKYQEKLTELRQAAEELIPQFAEAEDLPAAEPVKEEIAGPLAPSPLASAATDAVATEPVGPPSPAAESASKSDKKAQKAERAKEAKAAKAARKAEKAAAGGVPVSTWIMVVLAVIAIAATAFFALRFRAASAQDTATSAEYETMTQSIAIMEEQIPGTQRLIEGLEEGRLALLENREFKLCNLSSRDMRVEWIHATYANPDGTLTSFDSAYFGYPFWTVAPGGTQKFNHTIDDQTIWDGSAIFFALQVKYRGRYTFRSGAMAAADEDCYSLKLD